MKYLLIPIHFLKFFYPETLFFFFRTWKNLILYLEEDLAVGLMWKLLFAPLFHDTTILGRVLSLIFRVVRILLGLFAFTMVSVLILGLALAWFLLPVWVFWSSAPGGWISLILFAAAGLFLIHIITSPHKTTWQILKVGDLWLASLIQKNKLSMQTLLQAKEVQSLLVLLEVEPDKFAQVSLTDTQKIGQEALDLAKASGAKYIGPAHFFVAAIKNSPQIDNFLLNLNLHLQDFEEALKFLERKINKWRRVYIWDNDFAVHHLKGINRGWLGAPTPSLDRVSRDLTKIAAKSGRAEFLGRSHAVAEVVNILSAENGKNVLLVGLPGSGKTTLVEHLARQIISGDAPPALATKRIVVLDLTSLLSGTKTQGELAEKVKIIFDEVSFAGNVIIVIEEIQELGVGEAGTLMNVYSLILPFIESASFQFIGITEPESYIKVLEKNTAFVRLFTKVELSPATLLETILILEDIAIEVERRQNLRVSYLAIKKCAELSEKFIHERVLPDSTISIFNEALTLRQSGNRVTSQIIEEVFSERVKVPVSELGLEGKKKLLNLESEIHEKLIDQEEAVRAVSDSLRRSATGLREKGRPIGSFLFVGPTGVGKTELAKILAEVYFKDAFIRFDMSEYQSSDSANRLIGVSGEGGSLTEAVRQRQYALLLLDEFEKANPNILNLFLQVLDDGRLTDGAGRTIDFTNTIIIATSNAASLLIAEGLKQGRMLGELDKQVNSELLKVFKPELINRFDDIVLFKTLSEADLQKIVLLKLNVLKAQMEKQGYLIEFEEVLVRQLAERGFDPVLGARPLRRLIQDTLEAKLSKMILENQLQKGKPFKVGVDCL